MPSSLRLRSAPTASVKRCSRFQRSPSGSRTGRLANRWHGSNVITEPSKRPQTTRPLEAPKSIAANSRKVEDLFEAIERELLREERRHVRLPARIDVRGVHGRGRGLEVLRLEVADQQPVPAQEERVVAPAGLVERVEHLGPDGPVALAVLVDAFGADVQLKADALHDSAHLRVLEPEQSRHVADLARDMADAERHVMRRAVLAP